MIFEKLNINKHDLSQVADIVYDVDFRTFDLIYKSRSKAVNDISKMLLKDNYEYFYVILEEGEIIGILSLYINKKPSFIHSLLEFNSFRWLLIDILDYFVLSDVQNNDLHIGMLAISDKFRGKGFGSKVLKKVIEESRKGNFKRVTLDVDFRNTNARKLYEKIGFKEFNRKSLKIGNFERGMNNLEYSL